MRLTPVYMLLLVAAIAGGFSSCSRSDNSGSDRKSSNPDVEITSESFNFDMLSARQQYMVKTSDPETYYITLEANVQYPEKIGKYDLKHLQDTLAYFIDKDNAASIESAITAFVSNPQVFEGETNYKVVDSIPADFDQSRAFYSNVDIKVQEISSDMVTYNCIYETFLGGAHPMHGNVPFTYILSSDVFVNYKWLFLPGNEEAVTTEIRNYIMMVNDMTEKELDETMLVSYLPIPETVYIEDGMIVFHYNPYAILPYYFGAVDAKISPYMVKDILTPAAKALLIE